MRPVRSILDASFRYVPSFATSVATTWRRAGWQPPTEQQRKARHESGSSFASRSSLHLPDAGGGAVLLASPQRAWPFSPRNGVA
jgi:hypothetical protein